MGAISPLEITTPIKNPWEIGVTYGIPILIGNFTAQSNNTAGLQLNIPIINKKWALTVGGQNTTLNYGYQSTVGDLTNTTTTTSPASSQTAAKDSLYAILATAIVRQKIFQISLGAQYYFWQQQEFQAYIGAKAALNIEQSKSLGYQTASNPSISSVYNVTFSADPALKTAGQSASTGQTLSSFTTIQIPIGIQYRIAQHANIKLELIYEHTISPSTTNYNSAYYLKSGFYYRF